MAELAVRNIEYSSIKDFLPLGLMRKKYKLRLGIDKIPDQPRTGHAIDLNFFTRDPFHAESIAMLAEHPNRVFCGLKRKGGTENRQACLFGAQTWKSVFRRAHEFRGTG